VPGRSAATSARPASAMRALVVEVGIGIWPISVPVASDERIRYTVSVIRESYGIWQGCVCMIALDRIELTDQPTAAAPTERYGRTPIDRLVSVAEAARFNSRRIAQGQLAGYRNLPLS
jgi:hypothetical protein